MYFSLGETIAVLGIIIAVYGIIKPRWRLNFYLNKRILYSVMILVLIGILSSFASFVISAYITDPEAKLYADSLQGAAFIFFVFAMVDFIRGAFWRKPLYSHKSSDKRKVKFVQAILDEALFNKDEDSLNAVITIVRNSLDEICKDISKHQHIDQEEQDLGSYLLETLLSEEKTINHIVCKRLDFIEMLVAAIEKHHVNSLSMGNGVGRMAETLYINPDSYLYQQIGYDGLSNYASIYSIIFENEYLLREFSVITSWYGIGQRVSYKNEMLTNPLYPKVFIKGFTLALQKFGFKGRRVESNLTRGMYTLSEYINHVGRQIRLAPKYEYSSPASLSFHEVLSFVEHGFYWDVYSKKAKEGLEDRYLKPTIGSKKYRNESLSEGYCRLFVETAEAIVSAFGKDEWERHEVLSLNEVFVNTISSYNYTSGMRAWILNELWEKSYSNIRTGNYPAVFRALAIMIYWEHNNMPKWAVEERNKLIDVLRKELQPRILKGELMLDRKTKKEEALLPSSIIYDKKKKQFFSVDSHDNKSQLVKRRKKSSEK